MLFPHYLGGYSAGGTIVYEIAQQLHSKGEEVALLVIFDSSLPGSGSRNIIWWNPKWMLRFLYNLVGIIYDVSNFDRHQFRGLIKRKFRNIRKYFLRNDAKSNAYKEIKDVMNTLRHSHSEERLKFMNLHFQDLQEYKPNIYHGRITLFRADYQPFLSSFDPDNCWGKYATEGVVTINIPNANHNNFFTEPYVTIIAKELAKRITDLNSSKTKGKR